MKVLLDTSIIIHREASKISKQDIGQLFNWLDKLKYSKYVHPLTIEELNRNKDPKTVETMNIKIESYNKIKNIAVLGDRIKEVSLQIDTVGNDINDTQILNEVFEERVDILITEDKKFIQKQRHLELLKKFLEFKIF